MISPAKPETNSKKAAQYFREHFSSGDYYDQGGTTPGVWFGKGASELGLIGNVSYSEFTNLADNLHPHSGEHLTMRRNERRNSGEANRRCYQDFSISPPKSVSIQAIAVGDKRIIAAHNRAVLEAAKVLESVASVRVRSKNDSLNGKDRITGNICAAIFQHNTSRAVGEGIAPDPQLHSHLVIFNATKDEKDGNWKALQNYHILKNRRLATVTYYHGLAKDLQKMGYRIRKTSTGWELEHINDEIIKIFSKRRETIIKKVAELQSEGNKTKSEELAARIAHDERIRKQPEITPEILRKDWEEQMGREVFNTYKKYIYPYLSNNPIVAQYSSHSVSVKSALNWAKSHLFERSAVVRETEVLSTALTYALGSDFSLDELKNHLKSDKELLHELDGDRVTTQKSLDIELQIINSIKLGKNKYPVLAPTLLPSASSLTSLQRKAAEKILISCDFVTVFRGGAGTGKTFTLKHVADALEDNGKNVQVLAPQHQQVIALSEDFKRCQTLAQFLATKVHLKRDFVIIVDEAGQIGGKDMHDLLKKSQSLGVRIILSGDTRQHGAVAASDALIAIERYSECHLAELIGEEAIQRQKKYKYKRAVGLAESGQIAESFKILDQEGAIIEVSDRHLEVAKIYQEKLKQGSVLVASQTNYECDALNESIRKSLIQNGQLGESLGSREILINCNFTTAQKELSSSYLKNHTIILNRKIGDLRKGTECSFVREGEDGSIIIRSNEKEKTIQKDDLEKLSVFERKQIELAIGDKIQIKETLNINGVKLANGSIMKIVGADSASLVVEDQQHRRFTLPTTFRQFRYGYAATSYGAQGKTIDHVIVSDSQNRLATSKNEFYVSISRGRESCTILTSDKKQLSKNVSVLNGRTLATDLYLTKKAEVQNKMKIILGKIPHFWECFVNFAGAWFIRGFGSEKRLVKAHENSREIER